VAVKRVYRVSDQGRTVQLGAYSFTGSPRKYAKLPPLKLDQPQAKRDLPAGTYHLLDGRYQRLSTPEGNIPGLAITSSTSHRAAVGATEVTGTFRDATGREVAILAVGGGKLRVAFRPDPAVTSGWTWLSQASIQADSAVIAPGPALSYPLALRFLRPGVLQVRAGSVNGASHTRRPPKATIYHKISSGQPVF
jgi:hypothetical protein